MEKLTASVFALMIKSGANNLINNKAVVDALNVFPVPDGDTGTNMSLTFKNAAVNIPYDAASFDKLAQSASSYTLRGARGNSGVILSQIMRGIATASKGKAEITPSEFALCLKEGCDSAYRAVMKPTEGTILTVIRACADAALSAEEKGDFIPFFTYVVEKGNKMLDKTTDMLPALRQAGVVDAGGKGLMVILEGMLHYLTKGEIIESAETEEAAAPTSAQATIKTEDIKFAYCTEFIVEKSSTNVSAEKMKNAIEKIGDSMVVIDDDDIIKVHIHTNNPGFVLEYAVKLGELATVKIENMRKQHSEILEGSKPEAGLSTETTAEEVSETAEAMPENPVHAPSNGASAAKNAVLSVAAGAGVEGLFRDLGAYVISGGQTMNPSTDDILSAIETIDAENIYVLPNNKNIIMAAEQAAGISDKNVLVVPTKSIPQGISAMVSFNPEGEAEENASAMTSAAKNVTTGLITHAVRDTVLGDTEIHDGDILGMVEKDIVSVGSDATETAKDILSKMVTDDTELITVIYGDSLPEEEAESLVEYLEMKYPDCDVSLYNGEQPVYSYILSAE
ncbi:MAG: DAK2 domain-containing protein [Clostridia bacterium]|nr:DAK2 domain-containing protein [Clostridia bacterium]